jgi:DNA-binding NarL/FixJ family response regulator
MSPPRPSSAAKKRILVVDDHPLVRAGVSGLVNQQPDLAVCASAATAADAKRAVEEHRPDLILLDLMLGHSDGIELIKYFKALHPEIAIVILSMHAEPVYAERALKAGASGYVLKHEEADHVLAAMRGVLGGEVWVSRQMSGFLNHKGVGVQPPQEDSTAAALSDRELHVFQLLGSGLGTRQIADELGLSRKTIETYRDHIKHKLGMNCGADVVARAKAWVRGAG